MDTESLDRRLKTALIYLCYLIILAGSIYALYTLRGVLKALLNIAAPFIIGFIVAYLFDPIVNFLQRRFRLSRIIGLVVVYAIIALIAGLFLLWLIPQVYQQLLALVEALAKVLPEKISPLYKRFIGQLTPEQQAKLYSKIQSLEIDIKQLVISLLPGLKAVAESGATAAGIVAKGVVTGVYSLVSFFAFLSFIVVVSFYLIIDFSKIRPSLEPLIPTDKRARFFDLLKKVDIAVGGFIRGQLIDCVLVGALTAVLLLFLGFKQYALLIGFIAGVGNIVPYLGPILGATPAALWVLLSPEYPTLEEKFYGLLIIAGIFIIVQAIDGWFFQPKIVGKKSQLHPLLVLLALLVGANFGIGGLIVAIPLTAALRVLLKELWWQPLINRRQQRSPEVKTIPANKK